MVQGFGAIQQTMDIRTPNLAVVGYNAVDSVA